jgi:hypothetical protein
MQIKRPVGALQKYEIQTMLLLDLVVVTNLLTLLWRAILESLTSMLQMIHLSLSLSLSFSLIEWESKTVK